jgi:hypothetical protein
VIAARKPHLFLSREKKNRKEKAIRQFHLVRRGDGSTFRCMVIERHDDDDADADADGYD